MKRYAACLLCCALAAQVVKAQTAARVEARNPFASVSWTPPPTVAAVAISKAPAPKPSAPSAPPLPFKYLGRYTAGVPLVVLTMGEQMIVAKAGDTLEGGWRIDYIGQALIEFTYLPLKLKRSLATGDAG